MSVSCEAAITRKNRFSLRKPLHTDTEQALHEFWRSLVTNAQSLILIGSSIQGDQDRERPVRPASGTTTRIESMPTYVPNDGPDACG